MQAYEQNASPLLDFYQKRGLLISIDADGSPVETCQDVIAALAGPVLVAPPVAMTQTLPADKSIPHDICISFLIYESNHYSRTTSTGQGAW